MFVLSFDAAHYFQLKFFLIYFLIVFLNNARKSCAPFMDILFPHDKFLHINILPRKKQKKNSSGKKNKIPYFCR